MTCLRAPASLADAEQILVCAGGPQWRDLALLGLAGLLIFGVFVLLAWLAVRGTA